MLLLIPLHALPAEYLTLHHGSTPLLFVVHPDAMRRSVRPASGMSGNVCALQASEQPVKNPSRIRKSLMSFTMLAFIWYLWDLLPKPSRRLKVSY